MIFNNSVWIQARFWYPLSIWLLLWIIFPSIVSSTNYILELTISKILFWSHECFLFNWCLIDYPAFLLCRHEITQLVLIIKPYSLLIWLGDLITWHSYFFEFLVFHLLATTTFSWLGGGLLLILILNDHKCNITIKSIKIEYMA